MYLSLLRRKKAKCMQSTLYERNEKTLGETCISRNVSFECLWHQYNKKHGKHNIREKKATLPKTCLLSVYLPKRLNACKTPFMEKQNNVYKKWNIFSVFELVEKCQITCKVPYIGETKDIISNNKIMSFFFHKVRKQNPNRHANHLISGKEVTLPETRFFIII